MKRILLLLLSVAASFAAADDSYLGVYMGQAKLGYVSYSQHNELYRGKPAKRFDSKNVINAGLMGQGMSMKMSSTSWTNMQNRPLRMKFLVESGGRTQITDATVNGDKIDVTSDNSGHRSKKTLVVPNGAQVVDDPVQSLLGGGAALGSSKVAYVLDPMTVSLVKTTSTLRGRVKTTVKGRVYDATLIDLDDPRAPMKLFVSAKGDLIKAEGPFGLAMMPETKQQAMGSDASGYQPSTDLAISSSIKTDKPISDPASIKRLVIRITGQDLSKLPSDNHQTVNREGSSWMVDLHPPKLNVGTAATISQASALRPQWTRATTHISSDDPQIRALAKRIVGSRTNVLAAALAIKDYVNRSMRPNAGIGVLRDAVEILNTKEGVCRDYAVLSAALMRAAHIPTRLASGIVSFDGTFYYHAWVEVFEGKQWIGLDSTVPGAQITSTHVKLSEGNVEDAFVFTFLDKVKLEVLKIERN